MNTWKELSPEQLEYQFNPQCSVQNFSEFQVARTAVSVTCRSAFRSHLDVAYGPGALHKVDIFPGGQKSPVHLFFHGGYWRTQDKINFAFIARDLVPRGVTLVVVNYDLCPAATLDGVVASARDAIAWTYRNIAEFGGDPGRITISGNSAGAHLCSMALATDWTARQIPNDVIKGAVMISGVFDPEPARHISVNKEIGLTDDIARRNNSESLPIWVECDRLWIFAGGSEPWMFVDQSFRYANHLRRQGREAEVHVLPGYHHFNIMDQYLDPGAPISRAIAQVTAL